MNLILATDSYKLTHWKQYPENTTGVYSYFESREGAEFDETVFFGLQPLLEKLAEGVTPLDLDEAAAFADIHLGPGLFNWNGWAHVLETHRGHLPLRIRAVPEGTVVPTGNVLMTVENTCPQCFWMTNYVETLLTHVWYPSTVASLSRTAKRIFAEYLQATGSDMSGLQFMLHDFGYRGVSSEESAAIGAAAHLVNFSGTDTIAGWLLAQKTYDADPASLAFSVPATEHSVMTSLGREGEIEQLDRVLAQYPTGIVSVVADSYNIYDFTDQVCARKAQILSRDGRFVLRPDSTTDKHHTPHGLVKHLMGRLWDTFGGTTTATGHKVLDPHIRVLWGDGIGLSDMASILFNLRVYGYAAENMVFGMGGGLLQKVNRDTQRFAFKCSAQRREGSKWHPVFKDPVGGNKTSKAGRLALLHTSSGYQTVNDNDHAPSGDVLRTVFLNGAVLEESNFAEIRERAAL